MYTIFLSYSQLQCSKLKLSWFFLADVVSVAHYILVVEKEAVFQRLANDKFCKKNRCIVITVTANAGSSVIVTLFLAWLLSCLMIFFCFC